MRNIWCFARREYKHYFASPLAYVIAILSLLVVGGLFIAQIIYASDQSLYQGGPAPDASVVIYALPTIFLFTTPVLTMRLLADEQRMGTMELLLTAPVKDWELVVGKWLGAFLFILSIIATTLIYQIILNRLVSPGIDQTLMLACYLAIILAAATFLAIGTAVSAIFSNQFAAFLVTVLVLIFLWWLIQIPGAISSSTTINNIFTYLNLNGQFNNMMTGQVSIADIVYPLSLTALSLFLGSVVVEMRRWQ